MNPDVFILCRRKARGNSSYNLDQQLRERGISSYRVTAGYIPAYDPGRVKAIVNYGVSTYPGWANRTSIPVWYNFPSTVAVSANKLKMQAVLAHAGIPCLTSTQDRAVAEQWLENRMGVVARTVVNGARGQGIVLSPPDPLPYAPLYTQLLTGDNAREYRVYVVAGKAIDVTEKRRYRTARLRELGIEDNYYTRTVRTNSNGWAFARNTIQAKPEHLVEIRDLAEAAARVVHMGLGGVDIIVRYTDSMKLLDKYVVETNTSVSLVGDRTTRAVIADALAAELNAIPTE